MSFLCLLVISSITRVPIADIFQTKKRKKRQVSTTSSEYDLYDFWEEEYDYEDELDDVTPKPRINFSKYGKNSTFVEDDLIKDLPKQIYCDLVTTLKEKCATQSLLEMFQYDDQIIKTTTKEEVLLAVNNLGSSPWFGYETDFSKLLGGIVRNSSGHIVSATSALMHWSISVKDDSEVGKKSGGTYYEGDADNATLKWEKLFIETTLKMTSNRSLVIPRAMRSFGDISADTIQSDSFLLIGGYVLMFLYTIVIISKFNLVEFRLYLSISGILAVLMGISIGISISSIIGYKWTPLHPTIPLICLGIGIDDMFVIVKSLTIINKNTDLDNLGVGAKISLALQHSGVAITITTITDVFVFAVGAVTVSIYN